MTTHEQFQPESRMPNVDLVATNELFVGFTAVQRIQWAYKNFGDKIITTTSGGETSAIVPHLIRAAGFNPPIIFVDTGYVIGSTHEMVLWLQNQGYDIRKYYSQLSAEEIEKVSPEWHQHPKTEEFERIVKTIKHEPLDRAFDEFQPQMWIRGIMHWETEERKNANFLEYNKGIYRLHPILDWTKTQVNDYIDANGLRHNLLHLDVTKGPDQALECGIGEVGKRK